MAFGHVGALGTAQSKTSGTTLDITTTADAEVGNVIVVVSAWDNESGTGDSDDHTCADSAGNTYTKVRERTQGVSNGGATVSVFVAVVTTQLSSGGTITITHGGTARTAKAATAREFTKGAGTTLAVEQATGNGANAADPQSIALASMTSREYLLLWGLGSEGPNTDAFTQDADYTAFTQAGTTGGGDASNMTVVGGFRIATLTGDTVDASSDTADRDYAQVLGAVYEVGGGGTEFTITPSGSVTPAGALTKGVAAIKGGSSGPAGGLAKAITKPGLAGAVAPEGEPSNLAGKGFAGQTQPSGTTTWATGKVVGGSVTPTGAPTSAVGKILGGGVTPTGTLTLEQIIQILLAGAIAPAGALVNAVGKVTGGAPGVAGALAKAVASAFSGSTAPSGQPSHSVATNPSGSITPSGALSLANIKQVLLAGVIAPAGALANAVGKVLGGGVTPTGAVRKDVVKFLAGAIVPSGLVSLLSSVLGAIGSVWGGDRSDVRATGGDRADNVRGGDRTRGYSAGGDRRSDP